MRWRRTPRLTLATSALPVQPAPCTEEYDETVRHILGQPGEHRLTPAAVWFAHEIAWRPLVPTRGSADGADALACLETVVVSHGYTTAEVVAAGRQPETSPERRTADR